MVWIWTLAGTVVVYLTVALLLLRAGTLEDQARARARRQLLDRGGLDALARIGDNDG